MGDLRSMGWYVVRARAGPWDWYGLRAIPGERPGSGGTLPRAGTELVGDQGFAGESPDRYGVRVPCQRRTTGTAGIIRR